MSAQRFWTMTKGKVMDGVFGSYYASADLD